MPPTMPAATLNVDGVGPKTIQLYSGTASLGGEIPAGSVQRLTYSSLSTGWILNGFRTSLGTIASSGSAAVPTITFQVDTDTGFYLTSANDLGITVGGAQTVDLSTSTAAFTGNVTVSSSLDVVGNANFGGLAFSSATVASSFTVTGASLIAGVTETSATISSSLNVAGVSNLGGAVTMGSSLTVTGAALFAALTATTVTGTTVNATKVQQAGATLIPPVSWCHMLAPQPLPDG